MFSLLHKVFSPNTHMRRVLTGLCAAFLLATIFLSSFFVIAEADHECEGHDCPICLELQECISNFQLLGSAVVSNDAPAPERPVYLVAAAPCVRRAPATTLQSLDVRFDE